MGSGNSGLYESSSSGTNLPDSYSDESFTIGRSLSASALNYDVKDPATGKVYKFAEGTTISNVETFAGKGTRHPLKKEVVDGLTKQYGGKKSNWKHTKGIGTIDCGSRWFTVEVHWFENDGQKVKFKIKEWL